MVKGSKDKYLHGSGFINTHFTEQLNSLVFVVDKQILSDDVKAVITLLVEQFNKIANSGITTNLELGYYYATETPLLTSKGEFKCNDCEIVLRYIHTSVCLTDGKVHRKYTEESDKFFTSSKTTGERKEVECEVVTGLVRFYLKQKNADVVNYRRIHVARIQVVETLDYYNDALYVSDDAQIKLEEKASRGTATTAAESVKSLLQTGTIQLTTPEQIAQTKEAVSKILSAVNKSAVIATGSKLNPSVLSQKPSNTELQLASTITEALTSALSKHPSQEIQVVAVPTTEHIPVVEGSTIKQKTIITQSGIQDQVISDIASPTVSTSKTVVPSVTLAVVYPSSISKMPPITKASLIAAANTSSKNSVTKLATTLPSSQTLPSSPLSPLSQNIPQTAIVTYNQGAVLVPSAPTQVSVQEVVKQVEQIPSAKLVTTSGLLPTGVTGVTNIAAVNASAIKSVADGLSKKLSASPPSNKSQLSQLSQLSPSNKSQLSQLPPSNKSQLSQLSQLPPSNKSQLSQLSPTSSETISLGTMSKKLSEIEKSKQSDSILFGLTQGLKPSTTTVNRQTAESVKSLQTQPLYAQTKLQQSQQPLQSQQLPVQTQSLAEKIISSLTRPPTEQFPQTQTQSTLKIVTQSGTQTIPVTPQSALQLSELTKQAPPGSVQVEVITPLGTQKSQITPEAATKLSQLANANENSVSQSTFKITTQSGTQTIPVTTQSALQLSELTKQAPSGSVQVEVTTPFGTHKSQITPEAATKLSQQLNQLNQPNQPNQLSQLSQYKSQLTPANELTKLSFREASQSPLSPTASAVQATRQNNQTLQSRLKRLSQATPLTESSAKEINSSDLLLSSEQKK